MKRSLYFYILGDAYTDDSYRGVIHPNGNEETQKRVNGRWRRCRLDLSNSVAVKMAAAFKAQKETTH